MGYGVTIKVFHARVPFQCESSIQLIGITKVFVNNDGHYPYFHPAGKPVMTSKLP